MSKLDDVLEIEPEIKMEIVPQPETTSGEISIIDNNTDIDKDYELARKTFQTLIDKGLKAVQELSDIARNTEKPFSYEVLSHTIKTMTDTTMEFYNIQKTTKQIKLMDKMNTSGTTKIDKAVFIGSTADLLREIKKK